MTAVQTAPGIDPGYSAQHKALPSPRTQMFKFGPPLPKDALDPNSGDSHLCGVTRMLLEGKPDHAETAQPVAIEAAERRVVALADARPAPAATQADDPADSELIVDFGNVGVEFCFPVVDDSIPANGVGETADQAVHTRPTNITTPEAVDETSNSTANGEARDNENRAVKEENPAPGVAALPPRSPATKRKRETQDEFYPIHTILGHRRKHRTGAVDLLVHWGGRWKADPPTWQSESVLWEDCRDAVLEYWCPDGVHNTRTERLGLHPYDGPFAVGQILGKRRPRKAVAGRKRKVKYLVEYVGYEEPMWQPAECIPEEDIAGWHAERRTGG